MFPIALLCNALLSAAPPPGAVADGPTVTALEIVEVRRALLKPQAGAERQHFGFDRPGLKLVLEVQGPDVAQASHYGMLELDAAADDKGGKLKLNEDALGFDDIRKEFVEIDRGHMFMGEENPPQDLIRVELPFQPPARAASTISLRGKLQLKRVQTVDVLVPVTPGEVKNEQLEKLGVKFKIVKPEDERGFAYEVSGKLDALHEVSIIDAQGKALKTTGRSSFGSDEEQQCEITLEQAVPADGKAKLSLVVKSENVPVAIDLKDLKLP